MSACPCCGAPMRPGVPVGSLVFADLRGRQRRVVEAMVDAYPRPLESNALAGMVWGDDPTGGPDDALRSMNVHIHRANKVIAAFGWRIVGRKGAGRRLEMIRHETAIAA